jgi:hypothetical protein
VVAVEAEPLRTPAVIAAITAIGVVRGSKVLEALEDWALQVMPLVIAALPIGFGCYEWSLPQTRGGSRPEEDRDRKWGKKGQAGPLLKEAEERREDSDR